jgi:hypothetical protein
MTGIAATDLVMLRLFAGEPSQVPASGGMP